MTTTMTKTTDYLNQVGYYTSFRVYYRLGVEGDTYEYEDREEYSISMWNKEDTYRPEFYEPMVQTYFHNQGGWEEGECFQYLEDLWENFKDTLEELSQDWISYEFSEEEWYENYPKEQSIGIRPYPPLDMVVRYTEYMDSHTQDSLGLFWDYKIEKGTLHIYLILGDQTTTMDTRDISGSRKSDYDYIIPCERFSDLEDLDQGVVPWDMYIWTMDKTCETTKYILTKFLWNQLEGEVCDWEDSFYPERLLYLNTDTERLHRYMRNHPEKSEEEDLQYPGLDQDTWEHYCSMFNL